MRLILIFSVACMFHACYTKENTNADDSNWQQIDPPEFSTISLDMFEDHELDLPFFLSNCHLIANAVVENGEHRGFIDIQVWRNPKDNKPYNARIMESILTLAYFYTCDRPWNVYYGSAQLKVRLEAALEFWCGIQAEDGRFSEYGPQNWNLAATAFATKFMGETLQLLSNGPDIDVDVLRNSVVADRKAIMVVLTSEDLWNFGTGYSNQYSNVWAGALAYLDLYPDEEVERLFLERLEESKESFQSPAGYFYEKHGPDWAYNLGTHENNLMMAFHYTKGTDLGTVFINKSKKFADWLALNVVPGSGDIFFLNRSVETRRMLAAVEPIGPFITQGLAMAKDVPMMRPYLRSRENCQAIFKQKRESVRETWPHFEKVEIGQFFAMTPYDFLHRRVEKWFPTSEERQQAIQNLPCMSDQYFIKTLKDSRKNVSYTYINMPGYYAVFNHGEIINAQQRFGLSLLWSKTSGIVWQSQTKSDEASWGTLSDNNKLVEASDLKVSIMVDGKDFTGGTLDLSADSKIKIVYAADDGFSKELLFRSKTMLLDVQSTGTISEVLPLVLAADERIESDDDNMIIIRETGTVSIDVFGAKTEQKSIEFPIAGFQLHPTTLGNSGNLKYRVDF